MTSMKQKISATLVLLLFVFSIIPAGLAEEGSSNLVDVEVDAEADVESDAADAEVKTESKTKVKTEDEDSEVEEETEVKTEEKDGEVKEEVKIKTRVRNGLIKKEIKREVKILQNARRWHISCGTHIADIAGSCFSAVRVVEIALRVAEIWPAMMARLFEEASQVKTSAVIASW